MYKIRKADGSYIRSEKPGQYVAIRTQKIFGRLDCESGKRLAKQENRDFYHTLEEVVLAGNRPCNRCKPLDEEQFARLKSSIPASILPEKTLAEFYRRGL